MATKSNAKAKAKAATPKSEKGKSVKNRVRIRLQAFDHRLIDTSADKIVNVAKDAKGKVVGPIPLPTKRQVFCVLRSPHVDKKSREHFEIRTHRRVIDIQDPGPEFASQLSRLDLPAGVDIEVRL
ncbi:MAG: 30S ribosomal protein S10 [Vampirovibrio sp.]|nr:30S ribosomal protein S10 [Vampirovibrio sp.]